MKIFVGIVASLWIGLTAVYLLSLLWTVFDDDYEKRDVVRAFCHFLVAIVTTTALMYLVVYY